MKNRQEQDEPDGPRPDRAAASASAAAEEKSGAPEEGGASEAEAARAQVAALEDRIKRIQAEFLNETRRIRAQAESDRQYAIGSVVTDLVPIADALQSAASKFEAEGPQGARFREGIDLVARQLDEVLARHGVARIEAVGKPFDPLRHEAVFLVERADLPPQTVIEVLRPGFTLGGRVVRPAHVSVSRPPAPPPPEGAPSD